MKFLKNTKIKSVIILLLTAFFLLASIPTSIPAFTVPYTSTQIDLKPVSQKISNINLNPLGINFSKQIEYQLGLDLQGGAQLVYQVDMEEIPNESREDAFESARDIIERRINIFGATEPRVQTQQTADNYRIIVEIPGATDVSQATEIIGQTAQLSFWEEGEEGESVATGEADILPLGVYELYGGNPHQTELTGKNLESTTPTFSSETGEYVVQMSFDTEGTRMFAEITRRNVGKPVAIVLDDEVITAPVVNEPITAGTAVISGSFTSESAKNLSIALNAGALPAPLELVEQRTIGPTLGFQSLTASLIAGAIGLAAVVAFMVIIYRRDGAVASLALLIYTSLILFIFKFLGITLTLAGIAGLILSIGMAVDANILIFERMKEELRKGRVPTVALEAGFRRAWTSIRDSNVSSLITVFILYVLGTGIIKGFALALGIGIIVSMFTAIVITKTLLKTVIK